MTYAEFHLVFLVPAVLATLVAAVPVWREADSRAAKGLLAIAVVAVVYSTPWDAYLVSRGVWWYGPDRVLGTLLGVPLEEYAFFVLQTCLMGSVVVAVLHRFAPRDAERLPDAGQDTASPGHVRARGLLGFVTLALAGSALVQAEPTLYLGLILVWSAPVLALIWGVGGPILWRLRSALLPAVAAVTGYLWVADRIAIGRGIWTISQRYTVGWAPLGLPIEEALFFLMTNLMVTCGLTLLVRAPLSSVLPTGAASHRTETADVPAG